MAAVAASECEGGLGEGEGGARPESDGLEVMLRD